MTTFGYVSGVENPPLRVSDIKHLKLKQLLWDVDITTGCNGLVHLGAFVFGVNRVLQIEYGE